MNRNGGECDEIATSGNRNGTWDGEDYRHELVFV